MKTCEFKVTLVGTGADTNEAWIDAVQGFSEDPGPTPDESDITELENDGEEIITPEEWLQNLPTQILTDELKDDIIEHFNN